MTRKLSDSHYVKNCKNKFATWYSAEVQKQVDSRVNFEAVIVELERKLSVLKPIRATWLAEMYINFFTNAQGEGSCLERMGESGNKGCTNWKRSITACDHIKPFTQMTCDTCIYMFLNCIMILSDIIFSSESVGRSFQCKWTAMDIAVNWLKSNNSRTSMNCMWTLWELLFCHCWHPLRFCLFWRYCTFD